MFHLPVWSSTCAGFFVFSMDAKEAQLISSSIGKESKIASINAKIEEAANNGDYHIYVDSETAFEVLGHFENLGYSFDNGREILSWRPTPGPPNYGIY